MHLMLFNMSGMSLYIRILTKAMPENGILSHIIPENKREKKLISFKPLSEVHQFHSRSPTLVLKINQYAH